MSLDLRILARESINFVLRQAASKAGIQFPGQLIVKLAQQLGVKEQVGSGGEFVSDGVEEDFWTMVFVFAGGALLAFDGEDAEFKDVDSVSQENCFAAWSSWVSVAIRSRF